MVVRIVIAAALCGSLCAVACKDRQPTAVGSPSQTGGDQPVTPSGGHGGSDAGASGGAGGAGGGSMPTGPQVLFDRGSQGPKSLHASDQYLYWYESNLGDGPRILYAPKDGSKQPATLSETQTLASFGIIASDVEYVYWVESERVLRARHGGGSEPEAFPLGRLFQYPYLAIDGADLYVTDIGCFHVARVATSSFDVVMLRDEDGTHDGGGSVIVTDQRDVYCSGGHLGSVIAIPKTGGAVRQVTQVGANYGVASISIADGQLYVLQIPHSLGEADQSVLQLATAGGSATVIAHAEVYGAGSLLQYDAPRRAFYWVDASSFTASVHRLDLASSALTTVVRDHHLDSQLALDAERLYYVELDPSGIVTLGL